MTEHRKIRSWNQFCDLVDKIGFLPLRKCGVPGFSVQALTDPDRYSAFANIRRHETPPLKWSASARRTSPKRNRAA
jgi:hypothetical protein